MEMTPFLFGLYKFVKYGLYPLTWVVILMSLSTFLLLLPSRPHRLKWARISSVAALILLLIISNTFVADVLLGSLEAWYPPPSSLAQKHHDAIVVMAGAILDPGTLRPTVELDSSTSHRTTCGVDLYQQGYASKILLTGGDSSLIGTGPKVAVQMKRWAIRLGVPEQAILTEEDSRTTYENAIGAKRVLGPASILLVSSASHLPRATALFTKQGFQVTPAPCQFMVRDLPKDRWILLHPFDFLPDDTAIQQTREAVTELAGIAIYWLFGKI